MSANKDFIKRENNFKKLKEKANGSFLNKKGDKDAQYEIGKLYELGCSTSSSTNGYNEISRDITSAVEWYKRAAEQKHEEAKFRLGLMYLELRFSNYFVFNTISKELLIESLQICVQRGNTKAKNAITELVNPPKLSELYSLTPILELSECYPMPVELEPDSDHVFANATVANTNNTSGTSDRETKINRETNNPVNINSTPNNVPVRIIPQNVVEPKTTIENILDVKNNELRQSHSSAPISSLKSVPSSTTSSIEQSNTLTSVKDIDIGSFLRSLNDICEDPLSIIYSTMKLPLPFRPSGDADIDFYLKNYDTNNTTTLSSVIDNKFNKFHFVFAAATGDSPKLLEFSGIPLCGEMVIEQVLKLIKDNYPLYKLNLSNTNLIHLNKSFLLTLTKDVNLKVLNLSENHIDNRDFTELLNTLCQNKSIELLDLKNCGLHLKLADVVSSLFWGRMQALQKLIFENRSLKLLNVCGNMLIFSNDSASFVQALTSNSVIQNLFILDEKSGKENNYNPPDHVLSFIEEHTKRNRMKAPRDIVGAQDLNANPAQLDNKNQGERATTLPISNTSLAQNTELSSSLSSTRVQNIVETKATVEVPIPDIKNKEIGQPTTPLSIREPASMQIPDSVPVRFTNEQRTFLNSLMDNYVSSSSTITIKDHNTILRRTSDNKFRLVTSTDTRTLDLSDFNICAEMVFDQIITLIQDNHPLYILSLRNTDLILLNKNFLLALANNVNLRVLDLSGNRLDNKNFTELLHALSKNKVIELLDLKNCGLHLQYSMEVHTRTSALEYLIKENQSIKLLNVCGNMLRLDSRKDPIMRYTMPATMSPFFTGMLSIVEALQHNNVMQKLFLFDKKNVKENNGCVSNEDLKYLLSFVETHTKNNSIKANKNKENGSEVTSNESDRNVDVLPERKVHAEVETQAIVKTNDVAIEILNKIKVAISNYMSSSVNIKPGFKPGIEMDSKGQIILEFSQAAYYGWENEEQAILGCLEKLKPEIPFVHHLLEDLRSGKLIFRGRDILTLAKCLQIEGSEIERLFTSRHLDFSIIKSEMVLEASSEKAQGVAQANDIERKLQEVLKQYAMSTDNSNNSLLEEISETFKKMLEIDQSSKLKDLKTTDEMQMLRSIQEKLQKQMSDLENREIQDEVARNQCAALQKQVNPILDQFFEQEMVRVEQQFIRNDLRLKEFYKWFQMKLNQLLLAYRVISSGQVDRSADTTTTAMSLFGQVLPFNLGTLLMEPLKIIRNRKKNKKIGSFVSHEDLMSTNGSEKMVENVARQLTLRYQDQIKRTSPPGNESSFNKATMTYGPNGGAQTMAECAVVKIVDFLLSGNLNQEKSLDEQFIDCIFSNVESHGLLPFTNKKIDTNDNEGWNEEVFRMAGIRIVKRIEQDGHINEQILWFAGDNHDKHCCKENIYGFRLGTEEEVLRLKLKQKKAPHNAQPHVEPEINRRTLLEQDGSRQNVQANVQADATSSNTSQTLNTHSTLAMDHLKSQFNSVKEELRKLNENNKQKEEDYDNLTRDIKAQKENVSQLNTAPQQHAKQQKTPAREVKQQSELLGIDPDSNGGVGQASPNAVGAKIINVQTNTDSSQIATLMNQMAVLARNLTMIAEATGISLENENTTEAGVEDRRKLLLDKSTINAASKSASKLRQ